MTNPTMQKFGYPATLVREFDHWAVLVRPAQVTLGSLVLAARGPATSFGGLDPAAYAELGRVVPMIETALRAFVGYEKINYLMLMMVDLNVHFHVLPRYSTVRSWNGIDFEDKGWPAQPDLASAYTLSAHELEVLRAALAIHFTDGG